MQAEVMHNIRGPLGPNFGALLWQKIVPVQGETPQQLLGRLREAYEERVEMPDPKMYHPGASRSTAVYVEGQPALRPSSGPCGSGCTNQGGMSHDTVWIPSLGWQLLWCPQGHHNK